MTTILTDDERPKLPPTNTVPRDYFTAEQMEAYADARESAVLAKLAQQEPVAWLESDQSTASWPARDLFFGFSATAYSSRMHFGNKPKGTSNRLTPLYTHPAPQQADRQRVPEGYVLVPVEPTDEMVDAACDKSDFFRVDFVLAWDAAINASPELTQSATSHTHKVVPVTPTKEMLISGARAPVELLSPDGALQVYRAMLTAAPEAPAQEPHCFDGECSDCTPRQDFSDAYQGAREDLAIWKKRALEAEELNRKFMREINGQTFMGEPASKTPAQGSAVDERAAFEAWYETAACIGIEPTWAAWQARAALAQKGGQ